MAISIFICRNTLFKDVSLDVFTRETDDVSDFRYYRQESGQLEDVALLTLRGSYI